VIDPRVVLVRDSFVAMALVPERMCIASGDGHRADRITSIDSLARALPQFTISRLRPDDSSNASRPAWARCIRPAGGGAPLTLPV
jgi:hypothetical protein